MRQISFKKLTGAVLDGHWLIAALLFFSAIAWIGTCILLARGAFILSRVQELLIAAAAVAVLCALISLVRGRVSPISKQLNDAFSKHGLMLAIVVGIILRVIWVLAFPAQASSDGMVYLNLAKRIIAGDDYQIAGTRAYWPPGYPFFLSVWLRVFSPEVAVPISQIFLFIIGVSGVYRLTNKFSNPSSAAFSSFLFAIWPNLVSHVGTPEKEILVMALLIWAFVGILSSKPIIFFITGMALGGATLIQPSTQLLIPALLIFVLIESNWKSWARPCLFLLGAVLVIAPWSLRNYETLESFKLVSTNGGDVLYRANNPLATGGYTSQGEIDLSHLGEVERDRTGKELAVKWIQENPVDFLKLALEKQIRFMGDDAAGVFSTFRAQGEQRTNKLYIPLKLAANLWWLGVWLCIAALIIAGARLGPATFLVWGWIYFFALHSVFEAVGKYHVPMLWIPCVLLGILMADLRQQDADSE
jgi:hypothetical protein